MVLKEGWESLCREAAVAFLKIILQNFTGLSGEKNYLNQLRLPWNPESNTESL